MYVGMQVGRVTIRLEDHGGDLGFAAPTWLLKIAQKISERQRERWKEEVSGQKQALILQKHLS